MKEGQGPEISRPANHQFLQTTRTDREGEHDRAPAFARKCKAGRADVQLSSSLHNHFCQQWGVFVLNTFQFVHGMNCEHWLQLPVSPADGSLFLKQLQPQNDLTNFSTGISLLRLSGNYRSPEHTASPERQRFLLCGVQNRSFKWKETIRRLLCCSTFRVSELGEGVTRKTQKPSFQLAHTGVPQKVGKSEATLPTFAHSVGLTW